MYKLICVCDNVVVRIVALKRTNSLEREHILCVCDNVDVRIVVRMCVRVDRCVYIYVYV